MSRKRHPDDGFRPASKQIDDLPMFGETTRQHMVDLPTGPALASPRDKQTSKDAAASIVPHLSRLQGQVLRAFDRLGPMTAGEAEVLPEFQHLGCATVRKRVSELAQAGALVECGRSGRMTRYRARGAHEVAA